MFTKIILFAVLAACGVQSHQATSPDVQFGGDPEENAKSLAAMRDWLDSQRQMQAGLGTTPDEPDKLPPEDDAPKDQHWCCQSVNPKTASGEGCHPIGPEHITACNKVLFCDGKWVKDDDKVYCL
jgi:hypothetical protein